MSKKKSLAPPPPMPQGATQGATTVPPLSATQERLSSRSLSNAPARISGFGEEDISAEVARAPQLPSAWLDRLLDVAVQLPVRDGESAVVQVVVDLVAELLDPVAVGVCFVDGRDDQKIIRRGARAGAGVDPTRLFPGYLHEVVVELPELAGSTLHAASDDPNALASASPSAQLLARAANVLRAGLSHARLVAAAQMAQGEVFNLTSQITQAEKLASLGQIAAGMVHELNNPLTSIVAYTDYLSKRWVIKRDADPDGDAADELERLRRISDSAHRLLRFTRDLVTYARPSSETPVPVVVHAVIDQALAFCEHVLAESKTTVERSFGDGILPVRGLPEQLTQVFVNLITNACHAMPGSGGRVSIATELIDNDRTVRICLSDTGEGISESNVGRIFLPFFTTKANGRGTGLGLSIVQNIIESHGGRITVESELTKGTSFTMILPVAIR